MDLIAPDYYTDFSCIAGACRHSCCIGWEIDVDEDALARYEALPAPFGDTVRNSIDFIGDSPHFRLGTGERCPFLRQDGLCEMILRLGEDALCQICTDHPRFRSYFGDHTEIGLGLCCEAAADLIVRREAPMSLITLSHDDAPSVSDPQEQTLLSFCDMLLSILQDRSLSMEERLEELSETCACPPERPLSEWAEKLMGLERLDEGWTALLSTLCSAASEKDASLLHTPAWERAFEQLGVYFVYRHLPDALEDGDVSSKAAFAVLSLRLLRALCSRLFEDSGNVSLSDLANFSRMYSGEIEYSEENLWQIYAWLMD